LFLGSKLTNSSFAAIPFHGTNFLVVDILFDLSIYSNILAMIGRQLLDKYLPAFAPFVFTKGLTTELNVDA
jgi:hypothetical protein